MTRRNDAKSPSNTSGSRKMNRREFIKRGAAAGAGLAALATSLSPLRELAFAESGEIAGLFQKHYKELTGEEMELILKRIGRKVEREYGVKPTVRDVKPMDGVQFAYALNLGRCIGCRRCVHACVAENNLSRNPEIQYIRVLKMPQGTMDTDQSDHHYDVDKVPEEGFFYLPVQCHQCEKPRCVKVCPTKATWRDADGVVVIDYDWCIGCRYCQAACPYWARRFNFVKPSLPKDKINPEMAYLSNRPRPRGVVEKCTFCLQRTRMGKYPACLEACPVGARIFGNLLDEQSAISQVLKSKRVFILKEELGTIPRFFYFFDT